MEPLKTNKWVLTWMCVFPTAEATGKMGKMAHIIFTAFVLFGQFCGTIPHLAFFLKHISNDLEGSLSAFMGFTTFLAVDYIILSFYVQRRQIITIFEHLSRIYDSRKYWTSFCTIHNEMQKEQRPVQTTCTDFENFGITFTKLPDTKLKNHFFFAYPALNGLNRNFFKKDQKNGKKNYKVKLH